jgi:hypothetical protein
MLGLSIRACLASPLTNIELARLLFHGSKDGRARLPGPLDEVQEAPPGGVENFWLHISQAARNQSEKRGPFVLQDGACYKGGMVPAGGALHQSHAANPAV